MIAFIIMVFIIEEDIYVAFKFLKKDCLKSSNFLQNPAFNINVFEQHLLLLLTPRIFQQH